MLESAHVSVFNAAVSSKIDENSTDENNRAHPIRRSDFNYSEIHKF